MRRLLVPVTALALAVPVLVGASPAAADGGDPRGPATYVLDGDEPGGSRFEGIGVDRRERTFYVSEVTGGEIHRGDVRTGRTEEWLPEGADDRTTARGITTDRQGRVYIAGGPNGLGNDRPDLWVYDADGTLLAALRVDEPDAFLNDVAIGPDGAAYFTNSNDPQVFRVAREHGQWGVSRWADATGTIPVQIGPNSFNLGGIVVSPDRRALVVAQGTTGQLWRFDLRSRQVAEIDTGGAVLTNADGLVLRGSELVVIRNFARVITTLRLDPHARSAALLEETPTDPSRVFTTGKEARGRLLLVDSKFDEQPVAEPPYQVVALPLPR
ncbi:MULTISPECIES: SMP-30/gluconolactonase/LRE family protein [unclassified Blastococcus]